MHENGIKSTAVGDGKSRPFRGPLANGSMIDRRKLTACMACERIVNEVVDLPLTLERRSEKRMLGPDPHGLGHYATNGFAEKRFRASGGEE